MAYANQVVAQGQQVSGVPRAVTVDEEGHLEVAVRNPQGAYGELLTTGLIPVAQVSFQYNLLQPILVTPSTTGTGTVTTANGMAIMNSSAAPGSAASLKSTRFMVYRPGQGSRAMYTALYTAGVAGTTQIAGMGDESNFLGFGYNGTQFGILRRSGGVDSWIAQSAWSNDRMDGSESTTNPSGMLLDPTRLNVFVVQLQYLGSGNLRFFIEDQGSGHLVLVHQIAYTNQYTVPSLTLPSLGMYQDARNDAGVAMVAVKTASFGLFIEGAIRYTGTKYGLDNSKAAVTTLVNLLTLRTAATLNTIPVKGQLRIRSISMASDGGSGIVTLQVIKNTTLGGTPSYSSVNATYSIAQYDTAGTTITGGEVVWNATFVTNSGGPTVDLTDADVFCSPGDTLTFAAKSTVSTRVGVALNWSEDI